MTEPKFKPGMKVWSVRHGVVELQQQRGSTELCFNSRGWEFYFDTDGKINSFDSYPSLFTLDEARAMGFPVPKEKFRVEINVVWNEDERHVYPDADTSGTDFYFFQLLGKRGKMIFEEE